MSGKRMIPGLFSSVSDAELFSAMLEAESEQSSGEPAADNNAETSETSNEVK